MVVTVLGAFTTKSSYLDMMETRNFPREVVSSTIHSKPDAPQDPASYPFVSGHCIDALILSTATLHRWHLARPIRG